MPNGTVKFFNAKKGFGFITPDEGDKEIFLTATSLASAGIASLMAGQRVSFETKSEDKGPKAVNLTLIVNPNPPVASPRPPKPAAPYAAAVAAAEKVSRITIYHDPDSDKSCEALALLREAGYEPRIIEYLTTPLTREELIALSMLLRDSNQSLVRKYDPLFLELRLDDRFISENEFWGAIVENPALINGPVIATPQRASLCRSPQALQVFLNAVSPERHPIVPQSKAVAPAPVDTAPRPAAEEKSPPAGEKQPAEDIKAKAKTVAKKEPKAAAKAPAKPKAKVKAAVKAKAVAEPKKPVKKAVKKPIKKSPRAGK